MHKNAAFHIFSRFGVELEYMLVDRRSLDVAPIADHVLCDTQGNYRNEINFGAISWSNELALHIIELKNPRPKKNLIRLKDSFDCNISKINNKLAKFNAMLLPTGAHPWMNSSVETKLWPHGCNEIYQAYNKIFNCQGHGWGNLQSVHLNLPFCGDEEFKKLHTAIRILLPIIPALCASTPIIDNELTGYVDTRLYYYLHNQQKIPALSGSIIPEPVTSKKEYQELILQKIYHAISPYDPEDILKNEWLNSRAAIARFERNAIEIRVIDSQENPLTSMAQISLIIAALKMLVAEKWGRCDEQLNFATNDLKDIFLQIIKHGFQYKIKNSDYLKLFGIQSPLSLTTKELWQHIFLTAKKFKLITSGCFLSTLDIILTRGSLADRILIHTKNDLSKNNLKRVYERLAKCLETGEIFL